MGDKNFLCRDFSAVTCYRSQRCVQNSWPKPAEVRHAGGMAVLPANSFCNTLLWLYDGSCCNCIRLSTPDLLCHQHFLQGRLYARLPFGRVQGEQLYSQ